MDVLHSVQNSSSTLKRFASSFEQTKLKREMPMFDQFHPCIQDFIKDIVYVKANGNYGYHVIDVLLGMGEEIHGLWFIIICGKNLGNGLMSI